VRRGRGAYASWPGRAMIVPMSTNATMALIVCVLALMAAVVLVAGIWATVKIVKTRAEHQGVPAGKHPS